MSSAAINRVGLPTPDGEKQVVPGLRLYDQHRAWRHLDQVANEYRGSGLILAHQQSQHPRALGLSHYVVENGHMVALHIQAMAADKPFACVPFYRAHNWRDEAAEGEFKDGFIRVAAGKIGVTYAELAKFLANRSCAWRFEGWIDGVLGSYGDNSAVWRAMWGRLIEFSYQRNQAMSDDMPPEAAAMALAALRAQAHEGQIVLD